MGELKLKVSDETEKIFREAAMHQFGHRKGSFSMAAEKALGGWARQHEDLDKLRKVSKKKIHDSVGWMEGVLKGVKMTSVELQHETSRLRTERWKDHAHRS